MRRPVGGRSPSSSTTSPTGTCAARDRASGPGDLAAFATLRRCLVGVAQLLAPFCPFIADEIYDNLSGASESVHLCDFPVADPALRDPGLEQAMAVARRTVQMGHAARAQTKLKVRQPLRAAVIVATGSEREAISRLSEIVRDELNVHELRFVAEADELGEVEVKPNYRTLGPRFGASMPTVAAAIAGLDAGRSVATLRAGGTVGIDVGGEEHMLQLSDLLVSMRPLDGYQIQREGMHAVALDVELDDALRSEGVVRDIVRAVQNARQSADFVVTDRITLTLDGDGGLLDAVRAHEAYLAGEVLAVAVMYGGLNGTAEPVTIDGRTLKISVAVVDAGSADGDEDQPDDHERR